MIKAVFIESFFLLLYLTSDGQVVSGMGSGYTGTGAYSTGHTDIFSFTANQASLAQLKTGGAGLYGEKRFLLGELNYYKIALGLITSSGNFGITMGYFGSPDYNEMQAGLAYARKIGTMLDLGGQFNYHTVHIGSYGNASAIGMELGAIFHVTGKIHTGIHVRNPAGSYFGKERVEKLPSAYAVGFGYEASPKFLASLECIKEETQPVNVNAGFLYRYLQRFEVKAGISTATASAWAGVAFISANFRTDVMVVFHPQLGVTPALLIMFYLVKKGQ